MTAAEDKKEPGRNIPLWVAVLVPLAAIALMLALFAFGNPLSLFTANLPPIEDLNLERIKVVDGGFEVTVVNGGPDPVTIAQVLVDEAYWNFNISPAATIPRLGRATVDITYPWVDTEPHEIVIVTSTGVTFPGEVPVATLTPTPGVEEFLAYGLLGVYVGIIPVALGMLFYPAMRKMGRKWLGGILSLTIGLLVFLLVDTFMEGLEFALELPGVFQGVPLILIAALLTWLLLLAIGSQRKKSIGDDPYRQALYVATMIALGIGLHNLGEGLAIGVAFSIGEAALGSFLVIGFMLHNITEGVGIVAPLVPGKKKDREGNEGSAPSKEMKRPSIWVFIGLVLLAGVPAIFGAWIGGFAFSPFLTALFLGIAVGAIWQVIVEVVGLLRNYSAQDGTPLVSWVNLGGFVLGIAIMYLTAFLVKF
ncbi:MAG: ZIP family metal transporter [Chloroflexota bacterium]|nr:MAG: ZIP family metal transporter [Chloroflexota bacterium]